MKSLKEWFCIYEEQSEDGSESTIYGCSSDPTGANLAWENPFKVREVNPALDKAIEGMVEAIKNEISALREAASDDCVYIDEHITELNKALANYKKAKGISEK